MAKRGAKPVAAALRLVTGVHNVTRHGSPDELKKKAEREQSAFGPLQRPKHLTGHALTAWLQFIEPAYWIDGSRAAAAIAFCELWKEFRDSPKHFAASRHGQMRAYMSELGLTDERNRAAEKEKDDDDGFA